MPNVKFPDLSGVFPPIATPFAQNESLALNKLTQNFGKWNQVNFRGYVVLGSNGEFPYLTLEEKLQLVQCAKDLTPNGKLLIAGAGCESTSETIDLCKKFADLGVDAVLIHTPCFYKSSMTNAALELHYKKVADASSLPIILYNVPGNTGVELSADVVLKLASHPNIIGFKDSGGEIAKLSLIAERTQQYGFQVLAGSAGFLLASLHAGCVGGVCAIANMLGQETVDLYDLFQKSKFEEAKKLQANLVAPNAAVTRKLGIPGLKYMMDKFGYYGGPVRSPLVPLTADEAKSVEKDFITSGYTW